MGRRKKHSPPSLREHVALGLAYVTLDGRQVYLGPIGSAKAAKAYRAVVDDWERSHVPAVSAFASGPFVTVAELIAAHAAHAKIHYRRQDGQETDEVRAFSRSLALVYKRHADDSPNDFRPRDLHAIIEQLVRQGLSRETINKMAGRIKRVWQWGVSHEMVSAEAAGALLTVGNLQTGRTKAPDYQEVLPVDLRVLVRTLRLVPPTVATMLRVQYYCGARPGEVCAMRGDEIHRSSIRVKKRTLDLPPGVWAFIPSQHKNLSKGKSIRYLIGPRLQRILTPLLTTDGYLFPAPKRAFFRVDNYAQHIERACHEAGVTCQECGHEWRRYEKRLKACPLCGATGDDLRWTLPRWSPNQLRHNFLTRMDRLVGIAAASSAVSHASVATTAVYVEANLAGDAERAKRFG